MSFFYNLKKYYLNFIFLIFSLIYIFIIDNYRNTLFISADKAVDLLFFRLLTDLMIIFSGQLAVNIIIKIKEKNRFIIRFFSAFIVLFAVLLILILKTDFASFNNFIWDYSAVLENALKYDYTSYHHIFTVIYYIIALNLFPFSFGVMLFQAIIHSAVFSYIWAKLWSLWKLKCMWILLLPLFLFPVLRMSIQPIRSSIYYVFLLLLFAIFYIKEQENKTLNYKDVIILSILSAIVCSWRSENAPLLLFIPIMFFVLIKKQFSILKSILFLIIFYSISIASINTVAKECYVYSMLPFTRPISAILKTDFKTDNKEADLISISKCYSYDALKKAENMEALNVPLKNVTKRDVNNFLKTTIKLIVLNLPVYLQERIELSKNFTDFYILTDNIVEYNSQTIKIIQKLEFKEPGQNKIYNIINYSPLIPLTFIFIALIISAFRRKVMLSLIFFTSILLSILSYLFCAEPYFHYFLQSYIFGWFIFTYSIVVVINKKFNIRKS